ncbi:heme biosynthesis protein HemY [Kordiimonas aestuarii]|uniref:heme biosynthesis protein HemY n=1 Tax=Kordiimonas aestuarii TaxID=1005925 RepID=UPI0021D1DA77|nr:heme biosynthesis HemY N-terminal domain-containing protein [Kordiimonas aestuarii]
MTRIVLWFIAILVLAVGAAWLADHPGDVVIDFQGLRFYTSFAALTALAVAAMALAALAVWLYGWLRRDMPFFGSNRVVKRQGRGLKLLNQSLVALSAGDHRLAAKLIEQAEVLLPPQPMVHLIAAEAASRAGDHAGAAKRYQALEGTEDGRFLGLRGLVGEAQRLGRESEALRLARTAFKENRKSPWVLRTLFSLEVAAGNWAEAETALDKVARENLMEKPVITRHRSALVFAEATEANLRGDTLAAKKGFKKVLTLRPDFAPATAALAKIELGEGNKKRASKLIMDAWANRPHPTLARVFKALDAAEGAADWLKRVRTLTTPNPDHAGSMLLLVDALMDAREYDIAKPLLDKLIKAAPTRAAWQYRLALAHALHEDPDPIEAALAHAEAGEGWHCDACGHMPTAWSPLCGNCGGFDTVDWRDVGGSVAPRKAFRAEETIALLGADAGDSQPLGRDTHTR